MFKHNSYAKYIVIGGEKVWYNKEEGFRHVAVDADGTVTFFQAEPEYDSISEGWDHKYIGPRLLMVGTIANRLITDNAQHTHMKLKDIILDADYETLLENKINSLGDNDG